MRKLFFFARHAPRALPRPPAVTAGLRFFGLQYGRGARRNSAKSGVRATERADVSRSCRIARLQFDQGEVSAARALRRRKSSSAAPLRAGGLRGEGRRGGAGRATPHARTRRVRRAARDRGAAAQAQRRRGTSARAARARSARARLAFWCLHFARNGGRERDGELRLRGHGDVLRLRDDHPHDHRHLDKCVALYERGAPSRRSSANPVRVSNRGKWRVSAR